MKYKPHEMTAIVDLDRVAHKSANAGEKRSITVTHPDYNIKETFKNRQEFWGTKRSRDGGWLEEYNIHLDDPLTWDQFEITDNQKPPPLRTAKSNAISMIKKDLKASGAHKVKFYLGGKESYRTNKSTLWEYKGNRHELISPVLLDPIKKFLISELKPEVVDGIEADDRVTEVAYGREDRFVLSNDKDSYGQPTLVFNPDYPEEGIIDCTGLGEIFWCNKRSKKKVRGRGRKFLYWQILFGDKVDNYKANCCSKVAFGETSAFKAVVDCEDDKECWESMVACFQKMYPKPKEVVGWREDKIKIDWLYVLNEMLQMAKMRRYEGDEKSAEQVLHQLGIKYSREFLWNHT